MVVNPASSVARAWLRGEDGRIHEGTPRLIAAGPGFMVMWVWQS
jgi:hypothetical protein